MCCTVLVLCCVVLCERVGVGAKGNGMYIQHTEVRDRRGPIRDSPATSTSGSFRR